MFLQARDTLIPLFVWHVPSRYIADIPKVTLLPCRKWVPYILFCSVWDSNLSSVCWMSQRTPSCWQRHEGCCFSNPMPFLTGRYLFPGWPLLFVFCFLTILVTKDYTNMRLVRPHASEFLWRLSTRINAVRIASPYDSGVAPNSTMSAFLFFSCDNPYHGGLRISIFKLYRNSCVRTYCRSI